MGGFWRFISLLKDFVWGEWTLTLLIGTGIWLTIVLGFPQIRYFKLMLKEVIGNSRKKKFDGNCISPFAAMSTALFTTIGTGNIAGVATALHLGGPGALVWMFFSAILGMTTKFAEIVLAVYYREQDEDGHFRGGTMHILENALGLKWLAVVFAVFAIFASFGMGNMVQSNSVAVGLFVGFHIPHLWTGIIIAIIVGLVIWGGITRIAHVATHLVPFMAIFYVAVSLIVVFLYIDALPSAIMTALKAAFSNPSALPGALAGWGVKTALTKGISRVICTMSALVVLLTGVLTTCPEFTGCQLMLVGFQCVFGTFGIYVLFFSTFLFAISTIFGWYWYAETALVYLFGQSKFIITPFKVFWLWLIIYGAVGGSRLLGDFWNFSDAMNGFMAIPTLICLLLLTTQLRNLVQDFDAKRKTGELL